jgi:hypothetical protein
MAIMDVMETCADAAVMSDVVANDVYEGGTELTLTTIVTDGEYGSCVISGKKKWGAWFEKTHWFIFYNIARTEHTLTTSMKLSRVISTSTDSMNGEMKEQVTYTPSLGYIGVDECVYKACVASTDEESGELDIDQQRCYETTIVIIVYACAPEVRTRENVVVDFIR